MVRAADCRSAGPWFESGCALHRQRQCWALASRTPLLCGGYDEGTCHTMRYSFIGCGALAPLEDEAGVVAHHTGTAPRSAAPPRHHPVAGRPAAHQPGGAHGCAHAQRWLSPRVCVNPASSTGYIAQWLERLTADQQAPGSNLGVPSKDPVCTCTMARSFKWVNVKS